MVRTPRGYACLKRSRRLHYGPADRGVARGEAAFTIGGIGAPTTGRGRPGAGCPDPAGRGLRDRRTGHRRLTRPPAATGRATARPAPGPWPEPRPGRIRDP